MAGWEKGVRGVFATIVVCLLAFVLVSELHLIGRARGTFFCWVGGMIFVLCYVWRRY